MTLVIVSSLKLNGDARTFTPKTAVLIKGANQTCAPKDAQENENLVGNVHIKQSVPTVM